jgi:hypothetical protein
MFLEELELGIRSLNIRETDLPRYFFNITDSSGPRSEDTEGAEYPDIKTARREAEMAVRELIAEAITYEETVDGRVMEVADETGTIVARVVYKDILDETAS